MINDKSTLLLLLKFKRNPIATKIRILLVEKKVHVLFYIFITDRLTIKTSKNFFCGIRGKIFVCIFYCLEYIVIIITFTFDFEFFSNFKLLLI